ncbi:RES family NAD+ phosphorylase [Methylomagnum ishizawai]|uniref:RES family NAD+ phosphorylase n=1 Tax=Methylomagnum ishizawai TaxID=1760988 RepID=UPI001C389ED4|nr:RES domain-containing protein [Methylomagnum ishizawai]
MIRAWWLCQTAHGAGAFDGEDARRYGGRWNHKESAVVYTAATQSLAALEILVHTDSGLLAVEYLAVPSAIIPTETNDLLNPAHRDFAQLRIGEPSNFTFDPRLRR